MTESEAYFALNMIPNMGAATVRAAVDCFGSAEAFFRAGPKDLMRIPGIGEVRAAQFANAFRDLDWQREKRRAGETSVQIITYVDAQYPELLKKIHAPPLALYVTGDPQILSAPAIAIVGTRAPTLYGRDNARSFASRLAISGLVTVSGLARGVDTEVAAATLEAGGKTVAVIGSALNRLYPKENSALARRIVASGGAVISEYPFDRPADRQTFPMRNRIISGLCRGVLCVEAGIASGTLITADYALEECRSVMAIPGRISDPASAGCHKLLQNGARLITAPEDVLDEFSAFPNFYEGPEDSARGQPEEAPLCIPRGSADPQEQQILDVLAREGTLSPDGILAETGLSPDAIGPLLISLEIQCLVRRTPENFYTLPRRNA